MNAALKQVVGLLKTDRIESIRAELGIMLGGKGFNETKTQYVIRFLRKVEEAGKIRELEQLLEE